YRARHRSSPAAALLVVQLVPADDVLLQRAAALAVQAGAEVVLEERASVGGYSAPAHSGAVPRSVGRRLHAPLRTPRRLGGPALAAREGHLSRAAALLRGV